MPDTDSLRPVPVVVIPIRWDSRTEGRTPMTPGGMTLFPIVRVLQCTLLLNFIGTTTHRPDPVTRLRSPTSKPGLWLSTGSVGFFTSSGVPSSHSYGYPPPPCPTVCSSRRVLEALREDVVPKTPPLTSLALPPTPSTPPFLPSRPCRRLYGGREWADLGVGSERTEVRGV